MDAFWIAVALVVGVLGGWPVTAGILRLARSKPVRAVEAAEAGEPRAVESAPRIVDREPQAIDPEPLVVEPETPGENAESPPEPEVTAPTKEVLRGGLLIGFLERAAVAVAIFSGQPVAIAYVVAIKGLGRYPEIKDTPAASERFIIGTLASMLFSASVAVLTKSLLL